MQGPREGPEEARDSVRGTVPGFHDRRGVESPPPEVEVGPARVWRVCLDIFPVTRRSWRSQAALGEVVPRNGRLRAW